MDTNILIAVSRNREPMRSQIRALVAAGDEIGMCPIHLTEFYAGRRRGDRPDWDAVIDALRCWDISPATAIQAGHYRFSFGRRGRTIRTPDALNAAVAWRTWATVIAPNVKDYPVPGESGVAR